jgi:N-acyl amino acid synthase of PEP-CTERM/exosortase system
MSDTPEFADLAEAFHHYFEVVRADTDALRREVYRIRYQVFCEEMGTEDKEQFPEGLEYDEYDGHSAHCLLRHRRNEKHDIYAGCIRIVLQHPRHRHVRPPFMLHCSDSLWRTKLDPFRLPPGSFGEISRLAITREFRRRKGDVNGATGENLPMLSSTEEERRHYPYIPIGLYMAAAVVWFESDMDYLFAMMEPRLARHLRRYGICFEQAGEETDYHGRRAAFYLTKEMFLGNLKPDLKDLLGYIQSDLSQTAHRQPLHSAPFA